ncbi:hypothetical protein NVP1215B_058 [Vibrio phage 1.215.B._10N.222.54.F7]|nr:hypothetical protein NVP1215A_058 [Vibrio phage 1.215.A._10N.222.54.F7]AUR96081.1 hypothetical protein NVP1215B_058 [Vibrio phage 1.215.B._10N.222.54.F7]
MGGGRKWAQRDRNILEALGGKVSVLILSVLTGRTEDAVRRRCKEWGIDCRHRGEGSRVAFVQRETDIVEALAGKVPLNVLVVLTGRSMSSIRSKAKQLGKSLSYYGQGGDVKLEKKRHPIEAVSRAKQLLNEGLTFPKITEETGVTSGVLSKIREGEIHKDVKPDIVKRQIENIHLLSAVFR